MKQNAVLTTSWHLAGLLTLTNSGVAFLKQVVDRSAKGSSTGARSCNMAKQRKQDMGSQGSSAGSKKLPFQVISLGVMFVITFIAKVPRVATPEPHNTRATIITIAGQGSINAVDKIVLLHVVR